MHIESILHKGCANVSFQRLSLRSHSNLAKVCTVILEEGVMGQPTVNRWAVSAPISQYLFFRTILQVQEMRRNFHIAVSKLNCDKCAPEPFGLFMKYPPAINDKASCCCAVAPLCALLMQGVSDFQVRRRGTGNCRSRFPILLLKGVS